MSVLLRYASVLNSYQLKQENIDFITLLNKNRNKLHFNHTLEFQLSQELIDEFRELDNFVNYVITNGPLFQKKE